MAVSISAQQVVTSVGTNKIVLSGDDGTIKRIDPANLPGGGGGGSTNQLFMAPSHPYGLTRSTTNFTVKGALFTATADVIIDSIWAISHLAVTPSQLELILATVDGSNMTVQSVLYRVGVVATAPAVNTKPVMLHGTPSSPIAISSGQSFAVLMRPQSPASATETTPTATLQMPNDLFPLPIVRHDNSSIQSAVLDVEPGTVLGYVTPAGSAIPAIGVLARAA